MCHLGLGLGLAEDLLISPEDVLALTRQLGQIACNLPSRALTVRLNRPARSRSRRLKYSKEQRKRVIKEDRSFITHSALSKYSLRTIQVLPKHCPSLLYWDFPQRR